MVNFKGVDLRKANLKWTDLRKSSLVEANFQGIDIIKANLAGANLHRVDLTETNLREAHHLTLNQLSKVKTFHDAKLDKKLLNSLKKKHGRFSKVKILIILDP
jgi:uncharacterized protein YjbI with pentapeptide repeats